jgi:predicted NAD/FAD-binding protein
VKIAIVGAGIGGVGSAWLLSQEHTVDVYEANDYLGGHTCTRDLTVNGVTFPADTGFQVFNARTYPNIIRFFRTLDVPWQETDMSFSVQVPDESIEWRGTNLNTVFAQRKNIANPRFLRMLADVVRFSRDAQRLLADPSVDDLTLGELIEREGYGEGFTDWYLIPMGDAIWSTPPGEMLEYPAGTFLRFGNNHGMLELGHQLKWRSVIDGARTYVERASDSFTGEVHTSEPAEEVRRTADGVQVTTPTRTETYDAVVIASHPPETLGMLAEPTELQREIIGAFSFWDNEVILHTDTSFLPKAERAWAAWNWFAESAEEMGKEMLVLTYLINKLQKVPIETPVMETLNRDHDPAPGTLLETLTFQHPSFTYDAIRAQKRLPEIQGAGGIWYAGAWTRYGFHEDGLLSAVKVAEAMGAELPWGHELDASRTAVLPEYAGPDENVYEPEAEPGTPGLAPEPAPETD